MTSYNWAPRVPCGSGIQLYKNFWWDDSSPLISNDLGCRFKNGWCRIFLDDIEPVVFDLMLEEASGSKSYDYSAEQQLLKFDHTNCFYKVLPTHSNPLWALWVLHTIETHLAGIEVSASIAFLNNGIDKLVCLPIGGQTIHLL